jgi:hypothetical protein
MINESTQLNVLAMPHASCRRAKTLIGILGAISVCLAVSCASDGSVMQQATTLKRGDPQARALQLLGAPDDRQSEDDDEVLQYCKSTAAGVGGDSAEYALVWLYKGVVTGVTTYHRALTGPTSCASGFKAVHWEDAPDRIIEPRNR